MTEMHEGRPIKLKLFGSKLPAAVIDGITCSHVKGPMIKKEPKSVPVFRAGTFTLIVQFFKLLVTLLGQIVLSRALEINDFGLFGFIAPVSALASVLAEMGLSTILIQKKTLSDREINTIFFVVVISTLFSCFALAVSSFILAKIYDHDQLSSIGYVLTLSTLFNGLAVCKLALLSRNLDFERIALIDVVSFLCGTATAVAVAISTNSFWALVAGNIATSAASCLLAWQFGPWWRADHTAFRDLKSDIFSGLNIAGLNIFGSLNSSADNILIGALLGDVALGLYDRAWRFVAIPLGQFIAPFGKIAVPLLSKSISSDEKYRFQFVVLLQAMLALVVPGFSVAFWNSPILVATVLGEKWLNGAPVFAWICAGAVITPLNSAIFWLYASQSRNSEQFKVGSFVIAINFLAYAVGALWGIVGVAFCSALSVYLIQTPILVLMACRSGPVSLWRLLDAVAPFALTLALVSLWYLIVGESIGGRSLAGTVVAGVCAYIVELCAILLFRTGRQTLLVVLSKARDLALTRRTTIR